MLGTDLASDPTVTVPAPGHHEKKMGLDLPHPFWRSDVLQHQGGIVFFHRIYPPRVERFQSPHDLIVFGTLLGKKKRDDNAWAYYVTEFSKEVLCEQTVHLFQQTSDGLHRVCFLCSEESADRCHRRLLAEYLKQYLLDIQIEHL